MAYSLSLKVSISKKIELFLVEARYCERKTSQGCRKMRGAVGGHIGPTNYYTILQFFRTSDIPALLSFGSDGLIANETRRRNVGSGGGRGGRIGLTNYYTIPQFIKTSDILALQSFGSDGSAFGSKSCSFFDYR